MMFNKNFSKYAQVSVSQFSVFSWQYHVFFDLPVRYCIMYNTLSFSVGKFSELKWKAV